MGNPETTVKKFGKHYATREDLFLGPSGRSHHPRNCSGHLLPFGVLDRETLTSGGGEPIVLARRLVEEISHLPLTTPPFSRRWSAG
jgi:hypothetical protein